MITSRTISALIWLLVFCAFFTIAYLLVNTTFMFYDDEGYVLRSLQGYLSGHRLYDEVFTQYGPAPYVYHQLVTFITQQPLTHTLGRILTILHWAGCAVLVGLITQTITRQRSIALCTSVSAFGLLWQMCSEPTHPGSMISLLLSLITWITIRNSPNSAIWVTASVGLGAAALFLTKINIGLLLCASLGAISLRHGNWPEKWRRPARYLASLGLIILPWGLMGSKLHEPWVLIFAIQFSAAMAALLWVCRTKTIPSFKIPAGHTVALVAGFILGLLLIITTVILNGSSLTALLNAVLLDPLRHPANFLFGFTWIPLVWPVSVICWTLVIIAGRELHKNEQISPLVRNLVIIARSATLIAFIANAQNWLTIYGVGRFIAVCLPLVPLFAIPLKGKNETGGNARLQTELLALLALPQVLHAFPVAGSQMGWGTFLLLPIFAIGLVEAIKSIERPSPATPFKRYLIPAFWCLLSSVAIFQLFLLGRQGWSRYSTSKPLNLPGAYDIRMEEPARQMIRLLCLNTEIHADLLFSKPGMYSYNIWSHTPTPTEANATHWFWLLNGDKQAEIINRLSKQPRSVIIVNHPLDVFVQKLGISTSGPLSTFIETHYKALLKSNDFSLLVPNDSKAVAFGKILATTADNAPPDRILKLNICLPIQGTPSKIKIKRNDYPWDEYTNLDSSNSEITFVPIDRNGQSIGAQLKWPVNGEISGLFRVTILTGPLPLEIDAAKLILSVIAQDETPLAEAIF